MIIGRIAALFSEPDSFLNAMRIVSILAASTTILLVYFSVVSIAQHILFHTEQKQKNSSHVLILTVVFGTVPAVPELMRFLHYL
jgi:N-acetyl-anhydromuramyl-L-alanine amidase AmpD